MITVAHICCGWLGSAWEYWSHNPVAVSIVSIWAARLWSHVEHRGTSKKVEEIHKIVANGSGRDHD